MVADGASAPGRLLRWIMLAVVAVVLASLVPVVIGVASAWRAAREMAGPLAEAISSMSSTLNPARTTTGPSFTGGVRSAAS